MKKLTERSRLNLIMVCKSGSSALDSVKTNLLLCTEGILLSGISL